MITTGVAVGSNAVEVKVGKTGMAVAVKVGNTGTAVALEVGTTAIGVAVFVAFGKGGVGVKVGAASVLVGRDRLVEVGGGRVAFAVAKGVAVKVANCIVAVGDGETEDVPDKS